MDTTGRWRAALDAFEALSLLSPADRAAGLAEHDRDTPELAPLVRKLLDADAAAREGAFLHAADAGLTTPRSEDAVDTPLAGVRIGPYVLIAPLGRGGMGDVWRSQRADGLSTVPIALKVLHVNLTGGVQAQRFVREGRILGRLNHPNIARPLDAGVAADGRPYLALELVEGQRLDHWCDAHQLSVEGRIGLMLQVCSAVAYAHGQLIVHRDLKPSNILVTEEGIAKLLDFGIAKLLDVDTSDAEETELTRLGGRAMTPEYAAPEQITGAPVTVATDVYVLGVLLYQLLTGKRPFGEPGASAAQLERAVLEGEPTAPSRVRTEHQARFGVTPQRHRIALAGDLDTIVLKAIKKNPAERYASVSALADDLQRLLAHRPVLARPDSLGYRTRKFLRRNRVAVTTAAAVTVTLIAGVAATSWQAHIARDHARAAQARSEELARMVQFQASIFQRVDVAALGAGLFGGMRAHIETALKRQGQPEAEQIAQASIFAAFEPWVGTAEAAREALASYLLSPAEREIDRLADTPELEVKMRRSLAESYSALGLPERALAQLDLAIGAHPVPEDVDGRRRRLNLQVRRAAVLSTLDRMEYFEKTAHQLSAEVEIEYGPNHPETLRARRLVGKALADRGELKAAREWMHDLIERQGTVLGPQHLETLNSRQLLHSIYYRLDDPALLPHAEALLRDSQAALGDEHPQTLRIGIQLGHAYDNADRHGDSAEAYRAVYEARRRLLGDEHMETLIVLANLGTALSSDGDRVTGLRHLEEAWRKLRAHLGDDQPYTQVAGNNFAVHLRDAGRPAEALPIIDSIVRTRRATLGDEHPRTLFARNNLALTQALAGQGQAALATHDEVIAVQTRRLGPMHHDTLVARTLRSESLIAIGQGAQGRQAFEDLIDEVEAHFGRDSDPFRSRVGAYLDLLEELGEPGEVEVMRRRYGVGADQG